MNRILVFSCLILFMGCSNQKDKAMHYQLIRKEEAKVIEVAPEFKILEYGQLGNGVSNGTVAEVNGRYPQKGWGKNTRSDELVYVISGSGYLEMPNKREALSKGDVAFIPKGQAIAWKGDELTVFIPCIPAWTYEQHELME